MLQRLEAEPSDWDVVIIGGGATGLGCAIDAASRGYRTVLLEAGDFARGTSSRSTKLVHGGVRYLRQGNLSLVLEALKERGLLRQNAPHLVSDLPIVVPSYDWWEAPFYGVGLRLYDMLAGRLGFGPSRNLSRSETLDRLPTLETQGLRGGVIYHDGQFDDARLAIHMALTAASLGAILVNYAPVVALRKSGGVVRGVIVGDTESERELALDAKVVINATGPYADSILRLDDEAAVRMIRPSQGVHIVLDQTFLPGESAILVPHTDDGRVLFAIPWHGRVIVGTTDTPIDEVSLEPMPLEEEIDFLLEHTARYLTKDPAHEDILSAFAGIRPLVSASDATSTAAVSRDHTIHISRSGLVTVAGGKWTTYRKMAEDTIDQAATIAALDERPSVTKTLRLHGHHREASRFGSLAHYGADATAVEELIRAEAAYGEALHPAFSSRAGEVIWAVREEMARTVEDFLSRRTRALLLDAKASIEAAPRVAALMAEALGRDEDWQKSQIEAYRALARHYHPS
ncbi:MAG TPA: glycerol-3-phosphate dehydrogenase/oxidase [Vicinamibacteria bacterium]|nr:glycerol-3-phosphate dehydrogenase/oxidase [Vicinamibacteria bacterium]